MVNPDIRFNIPSPRPGSPTGSTRPSGEPSGSKNFEKVMKRDDRGAKGGQDDDDKVKEKEGEPEEVDSGDVDSKAQEKPANIFDMSRNSKTNTLPKPGATVEEPPSEELLVEMAENKKLSGKDKSKPDENATKPQVIPTGKETPKHPTVDAKNTDAENVSGAYSRETEVSAKDAKNKEQSAESSDKDKKSLSADGKQHPFELASEKSSKSKDKLASDFSREHSDLTYVNPLSQAQQQQPLVNPMGEAKAVEVPRNAAQMKELVDQIVKEMYVVKTGDVTDTVITIRHPPMFEGAQVKVTSFESARGEFNIAFENLSQQAKDLLDSRLNRESLLLALNKEGYNVHIMTTTTAAATPLYAGQTEQRDQEKGQQGQGQQEQQKEKEQQKKKG